MVSHDQNWVVTAWKICVESPFFLTAKVLSGYVQQAESQSGWTDSSTSIWPSPVWVFGGDMWTSRNASCGLLGHPR
jgi:hypothetical protein